MAVKGFAPRTTRVGVDYPLRLSKSPTRRGSLCALTVWALLFVACGESAPSNPVGSSDGGGPSTSGGATGTGGGGAGTSGGAPGTGEGGGGTSDGSGGAAIASGGNAGTALADAGGTPLVDWTESQPPTPSAPEARLVFPTYGATQAAQLLVHGTAYQAQSVTVNGKVTTIVAGSADASTWTLPNYALAMGDNVITVTGTDIHGKALPPVSVTVTRTAGAPTRGTGFPPTGTILFGLAASKDGKSLYSSQGGTKGIYRIELSTGNAFETDAFAGSVLNKTGTSDPTTSDVALVENGKYAPRLFGPDGSVALRYTDMTTYEFHPFFTAPAMAHLRNVAYHRKNDRLVVAVLDSDTTGVQRIISIDPSDATSVQTLADTSLGLKNFATTLLDETKQRLYYATYYDTSGHINFVNLAQPPTKGSVPAGTTQTMPQQINGMATCDGGSVLYLLEGKGTDPSWNRISAVDVATGNRHTVVDSTVGTGTPLIHTRDLMCSGGALFASLGQSFEAAEPGCMNGSCPENKIISIDPATGDRLVVTFFSANTQTMIPGK